MATNTQIDPVCLVDRPSVRRVAGAVDPNPEARDTVALGTALATASGAKAMLLAIEPDLLLVVPGVDWKGMLREIQDLLGRTRDALAPGARTKVAGDVSVSRGLKWLVKRERCDLLVVDSSRRAADGEVRIGQVTRQLFDQLGCAIAPRGLGRAGGLRLRRIAVGFDAGREAKEALAMAAGIARSCHAELTVRGVIDDRLPKLGWFEMRRGKAATSLLELADEIDLLEIGSRRWGPLARRVLGGTGEALVHGARCSLLIVPRPRNGR